MHIITSTSQEIKYIPRKGVVTISAKIRNEDTRAVQTKNLIATDLGNYWIVDLDIDFVEAERNTIELFNGSDLIYRGMILSTDQDIKTYQIEKDQYTEIASNNDYKTI